MKGLLWHGTATAWDCCGRGLLRPPPATMNGGRPLLPATPPPLVAVGCVSGHTRKASALEARRHVARCMRVLSTCPASPARVWRGASACVQRHRRPVWEHTRRSYACARLCTTSTHPRSLRVAAAQTEAA
eukprot:59471-Chlamydomonas_euryale.AAC.3